MGRDSRADGAAKVALGYCERAVDALREAGYRVVDAFLDLIVVCGVENLRAYVNHKITTQEYYDKIAQDLTLDAGMSVLGGIIGGSAGGVGGAAVGFSGAGPVGAAVMASEGAVAGAAKGAAAGYVVSRAARAVAEATSSLFRGGIVADSAKAEKVIKNNGARGLMDNGGYDSGKINQ